MAPGHSYYYLSVSSFFTSRTHVCAPHTNLLIPTMDSSLLPSLGSNSNDKHANEPAQVKLDGTPNNQQGLICDLSNMVFKTAKFVGKFEYLSGKIYISRLILYRITGSLIQHKELQSIPVVTSFIVVPSKKQLIH